MATMADTIKSAAIDLFFKKGYFAAGMSAIAQACGIQKASIYYHFPSKEGLLFSIMSATMDDLLSHLQDNLSPAATIEDRMRAAVRSHVTFHLERQKETFIATSELRGLSPEHLAAVVAQRDHYESIFQQLIQDGIGHKVFQPGDVKILSYAILTLCTAGASWYDPRGRLSAARIADIYETFVLNGLQCSPLAMLASGAAAATGSR